MSGRHPKYATEEERYSARLDSARRSFHKNKHKRGTKTRPVYASEEERQRAHKEHDAAYRLAHAEQNKAYQIKWRSENGEKIRAAARRRHSLKVGAFRAKNKAWRDSNPIQMSDLKRKYRYGLTVEDYRSMLDAQNWECLGCSVSFTMKSPHVDHDHTTGKVRGLLCRRCNSALGMAKDDPNILRSLIAYLEQAANRCLRSA
jgi:hypothetical protein